MIDGVELDYRTREQSDPRGKAKVFFSCHPADFHPAFELVSEDVLAHANCAVWYETRLANGDDSPLGTEAEEAFRAILDDMQLVVVAVSSRFLREPCRARELVLAHALETHIPVLPLLMEPGLEYEFNDRCAPIQVVNREVSDPTATPYHDVLKTFLGSVLVGDQLAERVRDAFDAYVFLSYRKKDRRHAQRLMRLIHENEEFRDIAIWYDEYLVPGEGFDAAIRAAFDKSSLFALAVTPNLLEQGNYVMEQEYPLAHQRFKDEPTRFGVVPVEMYELQRKDPRTDRAQLAKDYEEIPPVQDEHVRTQLDTTFVSTLERVARKTHDGSPRHRFFIGLAYLNGIDVEPNRARALSLLQGAAEPKDPSERPCIEASEKLVDMYATGDGVAYDLREAIRWQRTAASQWRAEYDRGHDPDEHRGLGTRYFRALMRLSDLQHEAGNGDDAIATAEEALVFADKLGDEVGVREMERDEAVMLGRLGALYRQKGRIANAEHCYRRMVRVYERLAKEMGTTRARRDLSIGYERLGDLRRRSRDLVGAEELYRKALELREQLARRSARTVVEAHGAPELEGRSSKALDSDGAVAAVAAADDSAGAAGIANLSAASEQARRDLSSALTKLGNVRRDEGDLDEALTLYERASQLDRVLVGELRTVAARDDWYVSLVKLGDVHKDRHDFAEAVRLYDEARAGYEQLVSELASLRHMRAHARTLGKLASALKYASRENVALRAEADLRFREAIAAWEHVRTLDAADEVVHELAAAHFNYAIFARSRSEARVAAQLWAKLSAHDPRYRRYLDGTRKRFGV